MGIHCFGPIPPATAKPAGYPHNGVVVMKMLPTSRVDFRFPPRPYSLPTSGVRNSGHKVPLSCTDSI
jgi:hypothetical protein